MKLRSIIFVTAFALGIIPLITLVAVNLRGHINRHEMSAARQLQTRLELNDARITGDMKSLFNMCRNTASLPTVGQLAELTPDSPVYNALHQELATLFTGWFDRDPHLLRLTIYNSKGSVKFDIYRSVTGDISALSISRLQSVGRELPAEPFTVSLAHPEKPAFIFTAGSANDTNPQAYVSLAVEPKKILTRFDNSYWLATTGELLHSPEKQNFDPQSAGRPQLTPGHAEMPETAKPFVTSVGDQAFTWLPVALPDHQPVFWIVSPVDKTEAEKWKASLIRNIIIIILSLMVVIFFIANFLAAKIDAIKEEILTGLDTLLSREEEVEFSWSGPQELENMAQDLTRLGQKYILESRNRRSAEAALIESENKFRNLTSSAQDAIALMDHQGNISYWNEAAHKVFGYTSFEAVGSPLHSLISPRLANPDNENSIHSKPAGEGPISETIELIAMKKDGSEVPIELSLSEARIQDKWHSIWIIRDISERLKAEKKARLQQQQLVQADKMISLGLLVAGVAHEINNPNSIAMLNTPMLARAWKTITPILEKYYEENGDFLLEGIEYSEMREQIPRLFSELEESARRIKTIVQDLKDYARQDTTSHKDRVNLNDIAEAAVRLTYNHIKKATDNFSDQYAPDLPLIKGNRQRLEQVIINLIQNSCDALDGKEQAIRIATAFHPENNTVSVSVEDEGCGIPEEDLNNITDPFFTTRRTEGGTGLGLSVSAGIVKEHNGTIRFKSSVDKGTNVTINFPVARQSEDRP